MTDLVLNLRMSPQRLERLKSALEEAVGQLTHDGADGPEDSDDFTAMTVGAAQEAIVEIDKTLELAKHRVYPDAVA